MTTDPERPRSSAAAETAWRLEMGVPKGSDVRLTGYPAAPQSPSTEAPEPTTPQTEPDGLYQRAQTRATPLLAKLADFSEDEWDELTHRMRKHFERATAAAGLVIVSRADWEAADRAASADRIDVDVLTAAIEVVYPTRAIAIGLPLRADLIAAEYDRLRGSR